MMFLISAGSESGAGSEPPVRSIRAIRFEQNPIITPEMGHGIGSNINGPSLIKVPDWLPDPLGKYYLYFSHHRGKYIRKAYADRLEGPWTIYERGVLHLEETICRDHIASPDVHVDNEKREIRMYFHGQLTPGLWSRRRQPSFVATSKDGIHFKASPEMLGDSYFRVFRWAGYYYAMARLGVLFRSVDGLTSFEAGPNPFETASTAPQVRHVALKLDGNTLFVFYSRIGDRPERILLSGMELVPDWGKWKVAGEQTVLQPEMPYEGGDLPLAPSKIGDAPERVRELRDPCIYQEEGKEYLLYSVAGESGIGVAELRENR
jgi:hypothetical protein